MGVTVSTLVVVPCGKRKIWDKYPSAGPTKAEDVYIGAPFKVNREYAEKYGSRWVVLSAVEDASWRSCSQSILWRV